MRFAHLSDVHLLSLKGVRWVDFLSKRWIGGLNLLTNRSRHYQSEIFEAMVRDINEAGLDHVIATGDITNVALEGEFAYAADKFKAFELGPEHVTVIPGNHDAYVEEGTEHFESYFADYFTSDPSYTGEHWPAVRVRGRMVVIGLSTSQQTPWFTCYGRLGDSQLAELEALLSSDAFAGMFRVVAIHHPPAGKRAQHKNRGLRDHADFAAVIEKAGAELVLHGHEHEDLYEELSGPSGAVPVRGIQSGTYEAGKPDLRARYRIYEIGPATAGGRPKVVSESLRVWNPSEEAFELDIEEPELVPEPA